MAFVTLLVIAVGVLSAVALVAVGLVEAPWQLLLAGLVAALYGLQRQSWASEAGSGVTRGAIAQASPPPGPGLAQTAAPIADAPDDSPVPETQELCYRGIRYRVAKAEGPVDGETAPSEPVTGIYRGQPWQR